MPTYWNPCLVFGINPEDVRECTGTTKLGKPCTNKNNVADRRVASSMLGELSRVDIVTQGLSDETKCLVNQIAGLTLCKKNHRGKPGRKQEEDLIRKWVPALREHIADGRRIIQELEQPLRQPAPAAAPRRIPVAQRSPPPRARAPFRRAASPPPRQVQREARVDPEPARRLRERAPSPAPAPAPRPIVPLRHRHIREEAPAVEEAPVHQRAARVAPPVLPQIRPRQPQPYQGPPVVRMQEQARNLPVRPLRPAAPVAPQPIPHVEVAIPRPQSVPVDPIRKPLERGCYVCYEDFDGPDSAVWCRQCGQNLHVECFRNWSLGKRRENVTCAYCRARWFD